MVRVKMHVNDYKKICNDKLINVLNVLFTMSNEILQIKVQVNELQVNVDKMLTTKKA